MRTSRAVVVTLAVLAWLALGLSGCGLPKIVIMDDPLSPEEHLKLARSYEQTGQYELAEKEYRTAAKKLPEAHYFLGNMFFGLKNYPKAESRYREAIRLMPDNPLPRNNLAWMFLTEGRNLDEAEELARRAVELAPADEKEPYQDTLDRILRAAEGQ